MSSMNPTTYDKALKVRYANGIVNATFPYAPIMSLIPRDEQFGGKNYQYDVRYATAAGAAPTLPVAQQDRAPGQLSQFTAVRKKYYVTQSLDGEFLDASENDADAFLRGTEACIEEALQTFGKRTLRYLFGDGSGKVGQITAASNVATNEITLTNQWDHIVFQRGDRLQLSTLATGASLKTGYVTVDTVTRVQSNVSKIKVQEATWATGIPTAAASDYIYFNTAGANVVTGFLAHIPSADPTAGDSFRGVDRSVDPVLLAGVRYSGAGGPISETITNAIYTAHAFGSGVDTIFMHTMRMAELANASATKQIIDLREDMPKLGFKGFLWNGPFGNVKIVGTPFADYGTAFGLKMNTWRLKTQGQAPKFLTKKFGLGMWIVEANDDAFELRIGMRGDLICDDPHQNINITL